ESLSAYNAQVDKDTKASIQSKRNIERSNRISAGWVNPLKGSRLSGSHLDKSRKAIRLASEAKSKLTWDDINTKCINYGLSLLQKLPDNYVELSCNTCSSHFTFHYQIFRNSKSVGEKICPYCFPRLTGSSHGEKELLNYIKTIYSGSI